MLRDDRTGRAAEIQIDLLIAHVGQLPRDGEKRFRAIAQQLRHQRNAGVVLRQNVPRRGRAEIPAAVRRDERGIVSVRAAEKARMDTAVYMSCYPFHGRKI